MSEHRFTEGVIRNGNTYRYCDHCNLMLFFYKDSKLVQLKRDDERIFYAEMARQNSVE